MKALYCRCSRENTCSISQSVKTVLLNENNAAVLMASHEQTMRHRSSSRIISPQSYHENGVTAFVNENTRPKQDLCKQHFIPNVFVIAHSLLRI